MISTLNIHFCGTQIKATRKGTASLTAINKFDDTLILSGVGAESAHDKTTNKVYPTPGTFDVNGLKQKKKLFHFSDTFFSIAGLAWGAGEEDNINYAMQHIDEKMRGNKSTQPVYMNISGYSRGGASAIRLANAIYQKYGNRIQLNLFLIDPNAGLGRHHSQRKKNIPRNVQNIYFTFSRDEKNSLYRPPTISHYIHTSHATSVFTVYLNGDHHEQELMSRTAGEDTVTSATINQCLLESFYHSYGANRQSTQEKQVLSPDQCRLIAKKGLCSPKDTPTEIDHFIAQMDNEDDLFQFKIHHLHDKDISKAPELSALVRCQQALSTFDASVLARPHNENYNNLGYSFAQLLSEIKRDYSNKQEKMNQLLNVTTRLIHEMNPNSSATLEEKNDALNDFKHSVNIGGYGDALRQIAAAIVGLVSGILLSVAFAIGGFFAGLSRWKTLGLASIPCTFIGAYNGAQTGFNWGRRITLGHENSRAIDTTIHKLNKVQPPEVKGNAEEIPFLTAHF